MPFIAGLTPPDHVKQPIQWFIFDKSKLLVKSDQGGYCLPDADTLGQNGFQPALKLYLGSLQDRPCYAARLKPHDPLPVDCEWLDLRALAGMISDELFWIAGRANHLLDWDQTHRYCGRCGGPTKDKSDERAKICPDCNLVNYPRLSPAVIVAVIREDQILLARNKHFRAPFHSVLAGFVEPGETLEQCVRREIKEEVGLEVRNIRYFGSQPWPFPNSLMVGFVADHAAGEIAIDRKEIIEAGWFSADALPRTPSGISIASRLIGWFAASRRGWEENGR
jgi:NAD+ diphosphatase